MTSQTFPTTLQAPVPTIDQTGLSAPSRSATVRSSHAVVTGGTKYYDWSDAANWSNGVLPGSLSGLADVAIGSGAAGVLLDDIASLRINSLSFLAGALALDIGAGNSLTIANTVASGAIKLEANARLLELKSGFSYVNLAGNNALVEMAGSPGGYVQFSTIAGVAGSLYIAQPQARTATAPGVDAQVIQNFALGDHIYIEELQTHQLSVTYAPVSANSGTLLISDGASPVYKFTNFQGSAALNYQVAEKTITDPMSGAAVAALDLFVSPNPKLAPRSASPTSSPAAATSTPVEPPAASATRPSQAPPSATNPAGSAGSAPNSSGTRSGTLPAPAPIVAPSPPVTGAPVIPQASGPGQVIGLVLQNATASALSAREITFGQEFQAGQVPAGGHLMAMIGGQAVAVQMDVKTTNPDGSVAMAILTLAQPAIAAGASTPLMLMLASGSAAGTPVDIGALAAPGSTYDLQVNLTLHNGTAGTASVTVNAAQALAAALKSGAYSTWLSGPQATQVRIDVPVAGSLHLTLDITAYADGTNSTDVTFNNDIAMSATGGTAVYDATITQHGAVAFQQSAITQYQYTNWDKTFASNGLPGVNVQHDVAALEKTGLIQNYDLTTGVRTALIASAAKQLAAPEFNAVLGNAGITKAMPMQGGRWDIGPTTQANTMWLLTQNATVAQYALDQAGAAGSIPWHLFDAKSGIYLTATANPKLWADYRAPGTGGTTALTQALPLASVTGWQPDPAHQPDLDYVAYLMTGDRNYLDQLNAQASYDILATRPTSMGAGRTDGREGALGIVADGSVQVRQQAWSLREIVEAAAANPDGSAEKAYFTQVENNNFTFLNKYVATLHEGEASGWLTGAYVAGFMAPWQQDFMATTVALAAEQGNAAAKQFLGWETNFLAGSFLSSGINPHLVTQYNLSTYAVGGSQIG
ncbi:MAG: hypothetical protein ABI369_07495, partial [Acetobacteraceae bacterium]